MAKGREQKKLNEPGMQQRHQMFLTSGDPLPPSAAGRFTALLASAAAVWREKFDLQE